MAKAYNAGEWPFRGRDGELGELLGMLGTPSVPGVVIAGNAGVGKTRLLREVAAGAAADYHIVTASATRAAATIPFGSLAHLMPEIPLGRDPDRFALFTAAAGTIRAGANGKPVLMCVDDAHALDAGSAALVFHLATTGAATALVTIRNGETIPDAVRALWKDVGAPRVDLEPLARSEASELLASVLGGQVEAASAAALFDLARGNAMYLREVVTAALEDGALSVHDGVWRWTGEVPGSDRLVELVDARLGRLDPEILRVAEIVAVGEPLGLRNLERLAADEHISEAERRGVIVVRRDSRRDLVEVAHPLYSEMLRVRMAAVDARSIRLQLAEIVESRGMRRRTDLLRVATWRLDADGSGDPKLLTDASRLSTRAFDPRLAERLARAAIEGGAGVGAQLAAGEALLWQARFADADEVMRPIDLGACDPDTGRRFLFQRVLALHWGQGLTADADAMLTAARELHPEPSWKQQVDGLRGEILAFDGPIDEAVALTEPLISDPDSDGWARFYGVNALVTHLAFSGATDTALEVLEPYPALAAELVDGFPHGPSWIVALRGAVLAMAGRLDELESLLGGLRDLASSVDDHQAHGGALMGLGIGALYRGALDEAGRWLRDAIGPLQVSDIAGLMPWTYAGLVRVAGERGDAAGSRGAMTSFENAQATRPRNRLHRHDDIAAEAWLLAAEGDLVGARARAMAGADELAELRGHEAFLLFTALRLGEPASAVAPRLAVAAEAAESELMHAWASAADALDIGKGSDIEKGAHALHDAHQLLPAAELWALASARFRDEGRADSARRAAARATSLLEGPCAGARTPALASLTTPDLTPRERETAELAARGHSNAEIAETLVVSVRTVEWHLQQVYAKLGVEGRGDLPTVLRH